MYTQGLTDSEAKQVILIQKKIISVPGDHVAALLEERVEKYQSVFTSPMGKKYYERLLKAAKGELTGYDKDACFFCDWPTQKDSSFLCKDCMGELLKRKFDEEAAKPNRIPEPKYSGPIRPLNPAPSVASAESAKPLEEEKPVEKVKPLEEEKLVEKVKPLEEEKPVEKVKPLEEEKPVEKVKPLEEEKPVEEVNLAEEEKTAEDTKPIEVVNPTEEAKSVDEYETVEKEKPVTDENVKRKSKKKKFSPVWTVLITIVFVGAALFYTYIVGLRNIEALSLSADTFARRFESRLSSEGWKVESGEGEPDVEPGIVFPMKSKTDKDTACTLTIYTQSTEKIISAMLKITSADDSKEAKRAVMMRCLAIALHDNLTNSQIMNLYNQMMDNGKRIKYGGYVWEYSTYGYDTFFKLTDEKYYANASEVIPGNPNIKILPVPQKDDSGEIIEETQLEVVATSSDDEIETDLPNEEATQADLLNYLGISPSSLETRFGQSESVNDEYSRVFENKGISYIVDENDGTVKYIELHSVDDTLTLCGLYVGMSEEDLKNHMVKQGISDEPDVDADGNLIYMFTYEDNLLELMITVRSEAATVLAVGIVDI